MNYRDKNGNCTADTVAKRCKCDHVILGTVTTGGECIMCENGKCVSAPAKKESEK